MIIFKYILKCKIYIINYIVSILVGLFSGHYYAYIINGYFDPFIFISSIFVIPISSLFVLIFDIVMDYAFGEMVILANRFMSIFVVFVVLMTIDVLIILNGY